MVASQLPTDVTALQTVLLAHAAELVTARAGATERQAAITPEGIDLRLLTLADMAARVECIVCPLWMRQPAT